jgi:nitrogen fixation/metabolism regulation signal transduction histidine kinase
VDCSDIISPRACRLPIIGLEERITLRKLFYIDPTIQFPFVVRWVALVAAELIFFALAVILAERFASGLADDMAIYFRYGSMLLFILLFSAINLLVAVRLSHRLAGPTVQILRALTMAKNGDYSARPRIRANDYLHEVSHAVNHLLQQLERAQGQQVGPDPSIPITEELKS